MKKLKIHCFAGCPPPDGVVVVIADPWPARGQPAKQHRLEDPSQRKTQLQIRPLKRVTLNVEKVEPVPAWSTTQDHG